MADVDLATVLLHDDLLETAVAGHINQRVRLAGSPAAAVIALDALDDELAALRADVADARAKIIAEYAAARTSRRAAAEFGISLAAVAKATRRASGAP